MALVLKDPGSALDYSVDWGLRYLTDDVLAESSWSVVPVESGGVTIDGSRFDELSATVNVSGGVPGKVYRLLNQITTSQGRHDSRSILVRVEVR
ncbi:hypothetical protein GGQ97_002729 [Sphingomonas kaistensis]|uniref:Uncharacterized protein n=1 Tax=Sphingomonas kaistensis TaxID=298708 RepID=A0A7X6BI98_9SPHN|nr:hypothetical protein [Sphingomonas kaistensis]NJC06936.1 hypothetical protein [Sphingomonas kaistensis]